MSAVLGVGSGLKLGNHDPSAAVVENGAILAAAEEERFNRQKHAKSELPFQSIDFCLARASIKSISESEIAFPLSSYPHLDHRLKDLLEHRYGASTNVILYDHHLCHAASSYLISGYDDALSISLDNSGDSCAGLVSKWEYLNHEELCRISRHNSLGIFYGMLTQFLGFRFNSDEYKVMGLSSFGHPDERLVELFEKIVRFDEAGGLELDSDFDRRREKSAIYTTDFSTRFEPLYSSKWKLALGEHRSVGEPIEQRHIDIAASAQFVFENVICDFVGYWAEKTKSKRLCLSGGCFLNVKAVAELRRRIPVDDLFIPPASGDNGLSLGAALLRSAELGQRPNRLNNASLGPEFDQGEVASSIESWGVHAQLLESGVEYAADALAAGKIIGWFQGRMEFGPRALGNRSILANPSVPDVKDRINGIIKKRERFRPFAPSVLLERCAELFPAAAWSPFMTEIFEASTEARRLLPAAVHVDGTARIQTVDTGTERFHSLISEFEQRTGIPAVLNTSFNIGNEPIVCSPFDAIRSFFSSPLEELVIGDVRVTK